MNHLLPQNAAQDLFHEMLRSRGIYLDLNFPYSINMVSLDFCTIESFVSETCGVLFLCHWERALDLGD